MNIKCVPPMSIKANANRRLVPVSEYKGPVLDLMFYEKEEISLLKNQISQLELEARDVIRTMNINRHLTGYQKNKCAFKLLNIETSIGVIKNKIYNIKKNRYSKQIAEYLKTLK